MIHAIRLSLGDATFDNVDIISGPDLDEYGLDKVLGEYTLMFKHNNRWHASHMYNISTIHICTGRLDIPGVLYDKIVLDGDKIFGPGKIIKHSQLIELGLHLAHETLMAEHIAFTCPEGVFITRHWKVSNIVFKDRPAGFEQFETKEFRAKTAVVGNVTSFVKKPGAKCCRSKSKR